MKIIEKYNLEVTSNFFFTFARFEYAMKACGYISGTKEIKPDWNRFSKDVTEVFEEPPSDQLRKAVEYYISHPPKKQTWSNGQLVWTDSIISSSAFGRTILIYVRRVRNNLFHGGKFKGRFLESPKRSEDLMRHGMTILDACLSHHHDLNDAYNK